MYAKYDYQTCVNVWYTLDMPCQCHSNLPWFHRDQAANQGQHSAITPSFRVTLNVISKTFDFMLRSGQTVLHSLIVALLLCTRNLYTMMTLV
jgi:hypothetical protein